MFRGSRKIPEGAYLVEYILEKAYKKHEFSGNSAECYISRRLSKTSCLRRYSFWELIISWGEILINVSKTDFGISEVRSSLGLLDHKVKKPPELVHMRSLERSAT